MYQKLLLNSIYHRYITVYIYLALQLIPVYPLTHSNIYYPEHVVN
jgi:hypothetical protein